MSINYHTYQLDDLLSQLLNLFSLLELNEVNNKLTRANAIGHLEKLYLKSKDL